MLAKIWSQVVDRLKFVHASHRALKLFLNLIYLTKNRTSTSIL